MDVEALVGKRIGNYEVKRLLGEGGMGAVFVAEHPEIKRQVAVKILDGELTRSRDRVERFIAEARVVATLRHPGLIEIYDFGTTDDGLLYYTMEVLDGPDLGQIMDGRGPFSPAEALPYVTQVCAALAVIHENGIVHRDLKPANIVVVEDSGTRRIKLLDFGIAKLLEVDQDASLTGTGTILGTPLTMAPEQATGRADAIGPHTDIYALGVILFWMMAGRPPFSAESAPLVVARHVMTPPPRLDEVQPTVPAAVARLVDECLAKDPLDRPSSASLLAARLAAAVASPPGHDTLPPDNPEIATWPAADDLGSSATIGALPSPLAVAGSQASQREGGAHQAGRGGNLGQDRTVVDALDLDLRAIGRPRGITASVVTAAAFAVAVVAALIFIAT